MRRLTPSLAVFALLLAACGTAGSPSTGATTPATTAGAVTTTGQASGGSAAVPTTDTPADTGAAASDRPPAPDFTLDLGEGGDVFRLSAETKPVFLVFWAEW